MATARKGFTSWELLLPVAMGVAWAWALITPLVFRLTRSAAPSRIGWFGSLGAHLVAATAAWLAIAWLRLTLLDLLSPETGYRGESFLSATIFWLDVNVFTYLALVVTGYAVDSHRRYVDRTVRAHQLETQLARAQLHYLELQLQPHFLFNSLNAVQELAHESAAAAERMLRKLHALLSMSLARSGRDEVTVAEEIASLEPYIEIQRTRFSDWLSVRIEIDNAVRDALVPHLILQPIVENAIRHGLAVRQGPGHIDIRGRRIGRRLSLLVHDNGVGLEMARTGHRPGIGLRNAKERLQQLYGNDHRFDIGDAPGGGTLVEIEIPYRASREASDVARLDTDATRDLEPGEPMLWKTGEFATPATLESKADDSPPAAPPTDIGTAPAISPKVWGVFVALWLTTAVFWTVQMYALYGAMNARIAFFDLESLRLQLAGSAYWIAVSPLVFIAARRLRLRRRWWVQPMLVHTVLALGLAFGHLFALRAVALSKAPILTPFNINPLTGNFFIYLGLVAWSHSRDFVAWYRAREITATRLAAEIAQSRFRALCVQLRPQFLLSTLELLSHLVHTDVPRAERLVARLADVLRQTLDVARDRVTTVRQELQLVSASVEAHRLGVRPLVELDIAASPDALAAPIPSRLLCMMVDDLLAAGPNDTTVPLVITVSAERAVDATRIRLHGDAGDLWHRAPGDLHAWWRKKSIAEAAVADAGPLVSVTFPDRATAVLILADPVSTKVLTPDATAAVAA